MSALTQRRRQVETYHHDDQDRSGLTGRYRELDIVLFKLLHSARVNHFVIAVSVNVLSGGMVDCSKGCNRE